ncbi:ThuA domain-containing protein [Streptomyces sp. NRRL S-146]|uniref:ThuA domain-containing protein n=1 Tax=Streptomyces sp. NRRL S-146 TaxID=1463884 RepID=UPI0004C801F2|nr:ThuA domain-containing protein [Streptomyces sp. NRRL S-146]
MAPRLLVLTRTTGYRHDSIPAGIAALRTLGDFEVHATEACTEYDWPYYGELLGARFARHPLHQPGKAVVEDHDHPATRHLPAVWEFTDEWYDFRTNPRGSVRVLATADESSYEGGGMGADHPLVWCRDHGRGRVFYTALGHAPEAYEDPAFRAHLLGGITWAARLPSA